MKRMKQLSVIGGVLIYLWGLVSPAMSLPPTIQYESLLTAVRILYPNKGTFDINESGRENEMITTVFLGYPENAQYNTVIATAAVKTAEGKVLGTYSWQRSNTYLSGVFMQLQQKELKSDMHGQLNLKDGKYLLEFADAAGKTFYKFPFEVKKYTSDDPYKPDDVYVIDGEGWRDYAYVGIQNGNMNLNLTLNVWLNSGSGKNKGTRIVAVLAKDGKLVSKFGDPDHDKYLNPQYSKISLKAKSGAYKAGDLLKKDGKYTFKLYVGGTLYGMYSFTVKGGKIQQQGRQVRESTDPLEYIEGGKDKWWIKRTLSK